MHVENVAKSLKSEIHAVNEKHDKLLVTVDKKFDAVNATLALMMNKLDG